MHSRYRAVSLWGSVALYVSGKRLDNVKVSKDPERSRDENKKAPHPFPG
jgi:hypothetical protein